MDKKILKELLDEIQKQCEFKERIFIKLFPKSFIKIFNIIRVYLINKMLKK
ncbi:MAG: hypothetical protein HFJ53_03885 [Clostridia bacterium]|nr:hypothetical protein [Clostridia bacterium]